MHRIDTVGRTPAASGTAELTAPPGRRVGSRNRHVPRLCRSCRAPMARQEDACWSCAAAWGDDARPAHGRRMIARSFAADPVVVLAPEIAPVAGGVDGAAVGIGSPAAP
jgi:hypothetical protein